PASAAADLHAPIVREQEHRPVVRLARLESGAQIGRPADVVEAPLRPRRLPISHALIDAANIQFLSRRRPGNNDREKRSEAMHDGTPWGGLSLIIAELHSRCERQRMSEPPG